MPIKIGQVTFLSFVPWNNYQGFRIYAKTVKYTNIIAFNILIQSKFPQRMDFLSYLILIP